MSRSETPLNLLQLTLRVPYPPHDGGAVAMLEFTRHLHAAGHAVTLAALNTRKHHQDPAVLADICTPYATEINTTPTPWGALRHLVGKTPYNIVRFGSRTHLNLLETLVGENHYDAIILEGVYLAQYVPAIKAALQQKGALAPPVVLRAHNLEYQIWARYAAHARNPLKRAYFGYLARQGKRWEANALRHFDGIAAFTAEDAAGFRALGFKGPVEVLPLGVVFNEEYPPCSPNETLGYLGSFEWLPNVQGLRWFLAEVWPLVQQAVPEAEVLLAGRGVNPFAAETLPTGVSFVGEVPDAAAFRARYCIEVVPLLAGSGVRVKILEAFAAGKAVVSTSVGLQGIPASTDIHVLTAEAPEDFAGQVVRLLREPRQRATIAQNGLEWVREHYNWGTVVGRWVEFLGRLTQKHV